MMFKLFAFAGAGGVLLLSGCTPAPLTRADVEGRIVCNGEQMAEVEREALRRNAKLQWVRCPEKVQHYRLVSTELV
jgi:hypothetical protein